MGTQHIETLVVGAGQAGLATGYELQRRGRALLIVDGVERVGDSWRRHWDSLRLFTPGKYDSLPGYPFPGPPWQFPGKDQVAAYLEAYAVVHDLPVRLRTRVDRLEGRVGGGFTAHLGEEKITCENVVVATGGNGCAPRLPPYAGQLDPGIEQLHSSQYRRPDQLPARPTLVVGAANSGCEIAHELAADRPVTLSGRDPGHEPFRPGSRADRAFVPVFAFLARHVLTRRTPLGRRMVRHFRTHGIPVGRVRTKDLADRGVTRREARVVGVRDGRPMLADGTVVDVAVVVWCTGSAPAFGWVDLPVLGDDGWPREYRGVAEDVPGLYFCGLLIQYAVASSVLPGVGRDAAYVARHIPHSGPHRGPARGRLPEHRPGAAAAGGRCVAAIEDPGGVKPHRPWADVRIVDGMGVIQDLQRAREAYERREWVSAYQALSGLADTDLEPDDFVALATAAFLLGRTNDVVLALQRAYQAKLDAGDVPGAVRVAYWLTTTLWGAGEVAVGNGWLSKGQRLLDDLGEDVVERGYLQERVTLGHIMKGEFPDALQAAPKVTEYGRRFKDQDLLAIGLHLQGRLSIFSGHVADGLRLLDEAMISVVAGQVSPIFSGVVYCSSIEACQEISDFDRAGQWTHALTNWCDAQPGLVAFTGQCAVHRGQLMKLHGAFDDAIAELHHAAARYAESGGGPAVGLAHYERAEVHRLRGEHDAAEGAYDEAAKHGHPAQPGQALLWLERGRRDAAVAAVRRLLTERQDPVHRSQVLPAAVDVLVEIGEPEEAAPLVEQLGDIGAAFDCTALRAAGCYADATVALARGDAESGLAGARQALERWQRLSAPYEAARSRMLVGRALRLLGDEESAIADLTAARTAFAELGAKPSERAATSLLGQGEPPGGLSPREVEVLRLVAAGKSNPQIAEALVLSEKTVARHLSNIFTKLDVGSRTAAAAFAYRNRLV